jgi:hypothetical protein
VVGVGGWAGRGAGAERARGSGAGRGEPPSRQGGPEVERQKEDRRREEDRRRRDRERSARDEAAGRGAGGGPGRGALPSRRPEAGVRATGAPAPAGGGGSGCPGRRAGGAACPVKTCQKLQRPCATPYSHFMGVSNPPRASYGSELQCSGLVFYYFFLEHTVEHSIFSVHNVSQCTYRLKCINN